MNLGLLSLHLVTYLGHYKSVPAGKSFINTCLLLVIHITFNEIAKSVANCYSKNSLKIHNVNGEDSSNEVESTDEKTKKIRTLILILTTIHLFFSTYTLFFFSNIQTYYKLFFGYLITYQLICITKIFLILETWIFVVDLIEIFLDCYLLHVILFISYTDPNKPSSQNILMLVADSFMQYQQTYGFLIFLNLLHDYQRLDKFISSNKFTIVSIIGEYDLMKYFACCLIYHYYFSFFNIFTFSYKHLINFFSVPISYYILNKLSKKQIREATSACYLLMIYNLAVYCSINISLKEENISFKLISGFLNDSSVNSTNNFCKDLNHNTTHLNIGIINKLKNEF
jgi:hypothetical protein